MTTKAQFAVGGRMDGEKERIYRGRTVAAGEHWVLRPLGRPFWVVRCPAWVGEGEARALLAALEEWVRVMEKRRWEVTRGLLLQKATRLLALVRGPGLDSPDRA